MSTSPLVKKLIDGLRYLPGVGPKSAQRMAFELLGQGRDKGRALAQILQQALAEVGHCQQCRTFTEHPLCDICDDAKRSRKQLCIVEMPADALAIEQIADYRGVYFVLLGRLSPLDGIGPQEIGIPLLEQRLAEESFEEVIIATNPTIEGETTAHFLAQRIKRFSCPMSRIAAGIPKGGELEYADGGTIAHALLARTVVL